MTGVPDLARVADRIAIEDLLDTYAHAIDTKDWDLLRTLFLPGAVLDYTHEGGVRGDIEDAIAWLSKALSAFTMCQHIVANRRVRIHGNEAAVDAYVFSPLGAPDGNGGLAFVLSGGEYADLLRRTPDGWRFASRTARSSWFHAGLKGAAQPPIARRT
jgi:SnoaL-like domain